PEEINRILTDSISRWLFVSEKSGIENLQREGIDKSRIHFVGNVMIDTLIACRDRIIAVSTAHITTESNYAVLTLHRPSNVDNPETFERLLGTLKKVQEQIPIVFPVHPRTRKMLDGLTVRLPHTHLTEPLGYLEFMALVSRARFVMTDSGGIQEETTYLGIPCVTLRDNTERPSTVEEGTNVLVGTDSSKIMNAVSRILETKAASHRIPDLWDGNAAVRILDTLVK